jgi:hypothetical protein
VWALLGEIPPAPQKEEEEEPAQCLNHSATAYTVVAKQDSEYKHYQYLVTVHKTRVFFQGPILCLL